MDKCFVFMEVKALVIPFRRLWERHSLIGRISLLVLETYVLALLCSTFVDETRIIIIRDGVQTRGVGEPVVARGISLAPHAPCGGNFSDFGGGVYLDGWVVRDAQRRDAQAMQNPVQRVVREVLGQGDGV